MIKNAITEWLQDIALMIGLYLILYWTGLRMEWFHGVFILLAGVIYGIMQGRRAIRFYKRHNKHVTMNRHEFEAWLKANNIDPNKVAERMKARRGEGN